MSGMQPTILMVIPSLEMGGAQSNLLRLATEFNRVGRRAIVLELKPHKRDAEYINSLLSSETEVYNPPFFLQNTRHKTPGFLERRNKPQKGVLKIKSERHWFEEFLIRQNVTAIHSHMYLADLYVQRHHSSDFKSITWLSKQCGCYNLIQSTLPLTGESNFSEHVRAIFDSLDGVVTMTGQHDDFLAGRGIQLESRKIYNGIRLPELLDKPTTASIRCVMCARDEPTKGWEAAVRGVLMAAEQGADVSLDLIASGPNLDQLEAEYGHESALRFQGSHPNPMSILSEYDIGLLPSTFKAESLPNTVVEYQASGLSTIATAVGEIPHLLKSDGLCAGVLIKPGQQAQMAAEIARSLCAYQTHPELLVEHRNHATTLRHRFSIEKTAKAYLDFTDFLTNA